MGDATLGAWPAGRDFAAFFGGPNGVSALPRVLAQIGWQLARQHALVQAECVCVCVVCVFICSHWLRMIVDAGLRKNVSMEG